MNIARPLPIAGPAARSERVHAQNRGSALSQPTASKQQLGSLRSCRSGRKLQRISGGLQPTIKQQRYRVQAVAGDKGEDLDVEKVLQESSDTANEELLLFFFQQDLETRLQRALNMDQFDVAQTIRKKMEGVSTAVRTQAAARGKVFPREATADAAEKQDALSQLKREMQLAAEQERYKDAAALRDRVKQAELSVLAASATLSAAKSTEYKFNLGQRVMHKTLGYFGIVCGMDRVCFETEEWVEQAYGTSRDQLIPRGTDQPFYLVLPDVRAISTVAVNYVAEDALQLPTKGDSTPIEHPYTYIMFLGPDAQGGYVPTKQLRDKYAAARRDVYPPEEDEADGGGKGEPEDPKRQGGSST